MSTDRYPHVHNGVNNVCHFATALKFYTVASGLLNETSSIPNRIFNAYMIRHERHIPDNKTIFCSSDNGFTVMDHFVHCHRYCGLISQHNHSQGITHECRVNTGLVNQAGCGIIVGRHHGNFLARFLFFLQGSNCDFLGFHMILLILQMLIYLKIYGIYFIWLDF